MDAIDIGVFGVVLAFLWPLILGGVVLVYSFKIVASVTAGDNESDATQKTRLLFKRRAFWTGIGFVILCGIIWYLPEIKDHFEAFSDALSSAMDKAKDAIS